MKIEEMLMSRRMSMMSITRSQHTSLQQDIRLARLEVTGNKQQIDETSAVASN